MVISGTDIFNLIVETTGIMMSVFALLSIIYAPGRNKETFRYLFVGFISLLAFNLSLLLLDLMDAYQNPGWLISMQAAGFLSYLTSVFTAFLISEYLLIFLGLGERMLRRLQISLTVVFIAQTLFLVYAQASGKLALTDGVSHYKEGSLVISVYIMVVLYMVLDLVLLVTRREYVSVKQKQAFIFFLGLPSIAIFLRHWTPELYLVELATNCALAIMLVFIITEQVENYNAQEKKSEQIKADLMLSQIQPHFLFNALYVIQEICHTDPEVAASAIGEFSRYLRHNMDSFLINRPIPFAEELEHAKHYVWLQQLRFGDTLKVCYELPCVDFSLPTLTLQPLVENAIRYGVRQNEEGEGTVCIRTAEYSDRYEVSVEDNGPGFLVDKLPQDGMSHVGLSNVRERVQRISGGRLDVNSEIGKGTTATIVIPKEK